MIDASQRPPLDDDQAKALEAALDVDGSRVVCITGRGGSGKTFLEGEIIKELQKRGRHVKVAAPTGKAARRVTELTGYAAETVHRLLEYTHPGERDPETGKAIGFSYPRRDRQNPLNCTDLIVDEYFMVNRDLHANIVAALPPGGRLIAVYDKNQLPPIEKVEKYRAEPTAAEILASKFGEHVLSNQHRNIGPIYANANRIASGFAPMPTDVTPRFITEDLTKVLEAQVFDMMDKGYDFRSLNAQLVVPSKKGWVGTWKLNTLMAKWLQEGNPDFIDLPAHTWDEEQKVPRRVCIGDKVLMDQNTYEIEACDADGVPLPRDEESPPRGMLNGEVGILHRITEFGELVLRVDNDEYVVVPPQIPRIHAASGAIYYVDPRKDLYLAFAMTTHKMQGSEANGIIYMMSKSNAFNISRPNFYTGYSRAKDYCTLITDAKALSTSLAKSKGK